MNASELKQMATGRYIEIVGHFIPDLIEPLQTPARGIKCPCHGEKDGFNFGKKFNETGRGYCQLTGSKDIFWILQMWLGWPFKESLNKLSEYLAGGSSPVSASYKSEPYPINWFEKKNTLRRYHSETIPDNGIIKKYLHSRGIDIPVPPTLRLHPGFDYYEENEKTGCYPAIVAKIISGTFMVGLHITYLKSDGSGKADVPTPRKIHSCSSLFSQGCIPLFEFNLWPTTSLLVGEGIETCLAAHELTGSPAWCAINARGLEHLKIPEDISKVLILADKDLSGAGLMAAEKLQIRLRGEGRIASVIIPEGEIPTGSTSFDWNDYLLRKKKIDE